MIVEERSHHVHAGKPAEIVRLHVEQDTAAEQEHPGQLVGALTVDLGDVRRRPPGLPSILAGEHTTYGLGEAWFERGADPALATTSTRAPTAFVRVLVLPAIRAGRRKVSYVESADADRPKTPRASVISERALTR